MQHGVIAGGCFPAASSLTGLGLALAKRRAAMEQYVGLDVSLKETSLCVVDQTGTTWSRSSTSCWTATACATAAFHIDVAFRVGLRNDVVFRVHSRLPTA
jgi:hypothetical protein